MKSVRIWSERREKEFEYGSFIDENLRDVFL